MREKKWLQQEIIHWQQEDLISDTQAQKILARYSQQDSQLARTVFSVIGAVIFGLGVILFFAWNWASMPHASKLAVIFMALLTAHTAGAFYHQKSQLALGEGLTALGTLLFGSGIFLVSQIYHIDEHYPNAFLLWASGALLLAWVLPSTIQGLLACILYIIWVSCELFDFRHTLDLAAPLITLALLPLAWQQRSRWFFRIALFTSLYALFIAMTHNPDQHLLVNCILLAFTLVAISPVIRQSAFSVVADIPRTFGYLGYLLLLVTLAFREGGRLLGELHQNSDNQNIYFYVLIVLALLATIGAMRSIANVRITARLNFALLLTSTVLVLFVSKGWGVSAYTLWVWANLAALAHATLWVIDGSQQQQGRKVVMACLLFSAIAIPRFIDLFDSMLMRSLMFLFLGASLFIVGNFYQRNKVSTSSNHSLNGITSSNSTTEVLP
jgi:uncharacterized membrane protein